MTLSPYFYHFCGKTLSGNIFYSKHVVILNETIIFSLLRGRLKICPVRGETLQKLTFLPKFNTYFLCFMYILTKKIKTLDPWYSVSSVSNGTACHVVHSRNTSNLGFGVFESVLHHTLVPYQLTITITPLLYVYYFLLHDLMLCMMTVSLLWIARHVVCVQPLPVSNLAVCPSKASNTGSCAGAIVYPLILTYKLILSIEVSSNTYSFPFHNYANDCGMFNLDLLCRSGDVEANP